MLGCQASETNLFNYSYRSSLDFPFDIIEAHKHLFTDQFTAWLKGNLHVFAEFAEQAKYVKNVMRRDHYSIRTIGEWVRHNSEIREKGNGYKLNNNSFAPISRLLMLAYPELDGLFETRERTGQ